MKISIVCFDLGHNPLGRAYILGRVLQRRYQVDIHGFLFPRFGNRIWGPCDTGEFAYRQVKGRNLPGTLFSMACMLKEVSGDVIYVCKLRMPNYVVGLFKKLLSNRPLVLDIDDLEFSWDVDKKTSDKWRSIVDPIGYVHTLWTQALAPLADEITTVSTQLQQRYGRGVLVPHGKDTDFFDPKYFDKEHLRSDYDLDKYKVIMFLGTAHPYKGLEDIVSALNILGRDDVRFVIVGKGSQPAFEKKLEDLGGNKVILLEQILFSEIPKFLAMADLVVLPQQRLLQTHGQIPGKVFDAMAMAKPIIATNVSDLPEILDNRGIIVEPEDIHELANKIEWVFSHPAEAEEMGNRAREKCVREYSWDVMEERLASVFNKYG